MIFEIVKFKKNLGFRKLKIFGIFRITNFYNFLNWQFLEYFKLEILENFQIENFWSLRKLLIFGISRLEILGIF